MYSFADGRKFADSLKNLEGFDINVLNEITDRAWKGKGLNKEDDKAVVWKLIQKILILICPGVLDICKEEVTKNGLEFINWIPRIPVRSPTLKKRKSGYPTILRKLELYYS